MLKLRVQVYCLYFFRRMVYDIATKRFEYIFWSENYAFDR